MLKTAYFKYDSVAFDHSTECNQMWESSTDGFN